ncbi:zinc knuckle CX2CX4HX4C containing protein, partial [Tanacetum coccineum]
KNTFKLDTIVEEVVFQDVGIRDEESGELQDGDLNMEKENGADFISSGLKNVDEGMGIDLGGSNLEDKGNISVNTEIPIPVHLNDILNPGMDRIFENENVRSNGLFETENGMGWSSDGGQVMKSGVNSVGEEVRAENSKSKVRDRVSFASVDQGMANYGNNKLKLIPVIVDERGNKLVDLNPVVKEGSKRWELIVIGYFVGLMMGYREISGHLRRMWRMYNLDKIIVLDNGLYFFKFSSEDGMQTVIENGAWLVDQKPLFVMKWEVGLCLTKSEPTRVPLWVKIFNIPLEAWNIKGISRIASRL